MDTKPYWQRTAHLPEFPLLTQDVEVDVAVVGGGLTGITAAYLLKKAGAKVALLERQRCAAADTGHTTAHLTYVTDYRLHQLVKAFGCDAAKAFWEAGMAAIDEIYEIVRSESIGCEFKWAPGFLHGRLDRSDKEDLELLEKDLELARELGLDVQWVESVPYARRPGVKFSNQAKFHPLKYLAALLPKIDGQGSHVFENSETGEIEADGKEPTATVHVGNRLVHCKYLMIATHNPLIGKNSVVSATLFQTKLALYTSYVLGARLPRGSVPEALYWDTSDPYYYLRIDPQPDYDYAIFGGEDCKTGQEADPMAVFDRLEKRLIQVLPQAVVQHRWLGQVVETND